MKIKLAILEADQFYLNRIDKAFFTKYPDRIEVYSFTDLEIALSSLNSNKIDVLIANESFDIEINKLPKRCGFAYFVDSADIEYVKEQRAICKFQKAELIYKQILSIYSEKAGSISGLKLGDEKSQIVLFPSVSGGVGTSSMAASAAMYLARMHKKVLYLNLEKFGASDIFFKGEGQFDMSDIVFALKSKNTNLYLKIESCVKQDISGVNFYSKPRVALDMYELTPEDVERFINELKLIGAYDCIIIDTQFTLNPGDVKVLQQANAIVWVGDGSEASNMKINNAYDALSVYEESNDISITDRISLIYNKFSNKTSMAVGDIGIKNIGGAPRYEHATTVQVLEQLSNLDCFKNLFFTQVVE